jgi:hypothetical protein
MREIMGALFDVFVVGPARSAEPTAVATALASRLGMAAHVIAKGLADRKLCAGQSLEAGPAQNLVRDLRGLGAMTMMQPSVGSAAGAAPKPASSARPSVLLRGAQPSPETAPLTVEAGEASDPFAPPPSGNIARPPSGAAPDPFAPPPSGNFAAPGSGSAPDPFSAPGSSPGIKLDTAAAPARRPRPAPPSRSQDTGLDEPSLELDTQPRGATNDFQQQQPRTVGGAAALNVGRLTATSAASGLSVDSHMAAEAYRIKCSKHGLFFDTRKASGCAKCLEPGRRMGVAMAEQARGFKLAEFDNPVKRAFLGLALALAIGFIPAAYHALGMGSREMRRLREEQEAVSHRPATEEIARRFEDLDAAVGDAKGRYMRNTGIIWIFISGGALAGWFRLTT